MVKELFLNVTVAIRVLAGVQFQLAILVQKEFLGRLPRIYLHLPG